MSKNKIKHSKIKNTGILFEILTRQLTVEVMNGDSKEYAKNIIKEFFKSGTELNKELRLYNLLVNASYGSERRAEQFVETVCKQLSKINNDNLRTEKYNLIKEIMDKFDVDTLFASTVPNYKVLASIYKVFESTRREHDNIEDVFNSKMTIVENITKDKVSTSETEDMQSLSEYAKLDPDVRMLAYKILLESFNDKYKNLNNKQSILLREYINNMANTSKFKEYVLDEFHKVSKGLVAVSRKIDDPVTRIKLNETIALIKSVNIDKKVQDKHISALMFSYELLHDLITKTNG